MANTSKGYTYDTTKTLAENVDLACTAVAEEMGFEFKGVNEMQICSLARQGYKQRLSTQTFQKKNRKEMKAIMEQLKKQGISVEDLLKGDGVQAE